ncbi:hypothetical protein HPHPH45_0963 [Helicobacter pylori Hp H-45]|uniref:Transmembrane protein n=1 Tax=Helicobacter pylori Hp H-45 TaxID=992050 RepID=I9TFW2_HELPX|nr:hypothetical protein HPHPH45_0963 [Helicobacter pylori Hp H-45]
MYLEYYSIKRFFFLSFGENFVIFLILTLDFDAFCFVWWWCGGLVV